VRKAITLLVLFAGAIALASTPSWISEGACVSINVATVDYALVKADNFGIRYTVIGWEGNSIKVLYETTLGERKIILMDEDGNIQTPQGMLPNGLIFITDRQLYVAQRIGNAYVTGSSNRLIYATAVYEVSTRVFVALILAICDVAPYEAKSVAECQKLGRGTVAVMVDTTAPTKLRADPVDAANTLASETGGRVRVPPPPSKPILPCEKHLQPQPQPGPQPGPQPQPQPQPQPGPQPGPQPQPQPQPQPGPQPGPQPQPEVGEQPEQVWREVRQEGGEKGIGAVAYVGAGISAAVGMALVASRRKKVYHGTFCPYCGYGLRGGEQFCPRCGRRLR